MYYFLFCALYFISSGCQITVERKAEMIVQNELVFNKGNQVRCVVLLLCLRKKGTITLLASISMYASVL